MMPFSRGSRICPGMKYVSLQSLTSAQHTTFPWSYIVVLLAYPRLYLFLFGHNSLLSVYSLAYMELYFVLGHLFRRFEMTLHKTSEADMVWRDRSVAQTMGELKVKLREAKE